MATFEVPIQSSFRGESFSESEFADEVESTGVAYLYPGERVDSWSYRYAKRTVDLVLGTGLLLAALVPGLAIALAVALTSRGPIFYREERVGRGGRLFRIWKFRSMLYEAKTDSRACADHAGAKTLMWRTHKSACDSRITRIGHILRRWSLDELPQLINVLRGDMSLIGPRPVITSEIPLYGEMQYCYLAATPGMSGLWQVSGRSNTGFPVRAELDASYVQNWSMGTDLKILVLTVPAVLGRVGAR